MPATTPVKTLTLDLGDKVALKLVQIPAGKFLMGSPETEIGHSEDEVQYEVTISKPFYMTGRKFDFCECSWEAPAAEGWGVYTSRVVMTIASDEVWVCVSPPQRDMASI